jgi:hypothetical protein
MKLDDCLIVFHNQVLSVELCPVGKNLIRLGESTGDEALLVEIVAS